MCALQWKLKIKKITCIQRKRKDQTKMYFLCSKRKKACEADNNYFIIKIVTPTRE